MAFFAASLWLHKASALPPASQVEPAIRPCCPLGQDVGTRLGPLRAPLGFDNVAAPGNLGVHRYAGRSSLDEKNGLVYSCHGGFVDLGHLRSAADWTGYLYLQIEPRLGQESDFAVVAEGADARVLLSAVEVPTDRRREIALSIAQRIAFDLAVWHEVVTWHGDASVSGLYSELFSAFSPEDIYSDALGVEAGARAVRSELPYDEAMALEVELMLDDLGGMPTPETRRALAAVEGVWWNRHVPLPEKNLLLRRNLDIGPELSPWRVEVMASRCGAREQPFIARAPRTDPWGVPLEQYYVLELGVPSGRPRHRARGKKVARHLRVAEAGEPFTPAELPELVAVVRREVEAELGPQGTSWEGNALLRAPTGAPPPGLADYQGIRIMQFDAYGGGMRPQRPIGFVGTRVVGGEADSHGGDISLVRYSLYYDDAERGLVTHITGIQARAMFLCSDRTTGELHGPLVSWFADCDGKGWLGVGGKLGELQHDARTGRTVTRPLELYVVGNAFGNAVGTDYLGRHANFFAGLSLDSVAPPTTFELPTRDKLLRLGPTLEEAERRLREADFSLRFVGGLQLLWRAANLRWEAQGYGVVRQDLAEGDDLGAEASVRLTHRLILRDDGPFGPGPMWGMLSLNLEGGWAFWSRPLSSLADFAPPLLSATEKRTLWLSLSVGFSYERFTL